MRHRIWLAAVCAALAGVSMSRTPAPRRRGHVAVQQPAPRSTSRRSTASSRPTKWLDHVRLSSVRFNSGGSGSFVSPDGLVMTNHHVGADDLAEALHRGERTTSATASTPRPATEEMKCKGLELNVLLDDQGRDRRGRTRPSRPGLPPAEAFNARARPRSPRSRRPRPTTTKNIRADVVTLYAGGQYHLYTFKKYTDIRLVFAPEQQIAFFGGDPDNFEYPRYDLDVCFFRVYENDKPVKIEHYLKWSPNGSQGRRAGVRLRPPRPDQPAEHGGRAGVPARHPATRTCSQRLNRLEVLLGVVGRAERGEPAAGEGRPVRRPEQPQGPDRRARRAARPEADGPQGGRGEAAARTSSPSSTRSCRTTRPRRATRSPRPRRSAPNIAKDVTHAGERRPGSTAHSFGIARTLVRAAEELPKPNGERLREFGDARLPSRSSSSSSPTSRSTRTSRRSSWPTR